MWKRKRFAIIGLLLVVVVGGSIAGVAFAQTGPRAIPGRTLVAADTTSANTTMLDRVAAILKIDSQTLKSAFTQARKEMRAEALDNYLKGLVAKGKITQSQADQYKQWWQSRPDVPVTPGPSAGTVSRVDGAG